MNFFDNLILIFTKKFEQISTKIYNLFDNV